MKMCEIMLRDKNVFGEVKKIVNSVIGLVERVMGISSPCAFKLD